ncbi:hypothetical protein NDU88_003949, partial [Pleurodeles waltl]
IFFSTGDPLKLQRCRSTNVKIIMSTGGGFRPSHASICWKGQSMELYGCESLKLDAFYPLSEMDK